MPRHTASALHLEGGLFPVDLIERLAEGDLPGQRPADFGLPSATALSDEIAAVWSEARAQWGIFQRRLAREPADTPATSTTRDLWVKPLLALLGYRDLTYRRQAQQVGGLSFAISHFDGDLPVHIEGCRTDLDQRPPSGRPRLSPHALLQEFLNRSEHLWGIVTNGYRLRLLRDNARMTRPAYVEFDLQAIFAGEQFAEFIRFYRLVHRSRLPRAVEDAPHCLLEQYYQLAIEQGGRVREKLRTGVEAALLHLGRGFLRHPASRDLREAVRAGQVTPADYYRYLLRLVYRLLFLMVSEERGLVGPDDPRLAAIYRQTYSVTRLRRLAERPLPQAERHDDLWRGLLVTFRLFEDEDLAQRLGMHALDGDLFGPNALGPLTQAHLSNADLLRALRRLSLYDDHGVLRWVNYAALDVEELGSVYESLLDLQPVFPPNREPPDFAFAQGTERKTTGSYYTRPELVQELVSSALDPVIQDRLRGKSTPQEREQALLSIKVIDPAAGSGHFLLAAARRLGRELARIRTGEEHPSPTAFRAAVREVIRHCIYGVDKNPLAVELCKVALWLESQDKGRPLTFLDHRIRVGDSLVGVFDLEVLQEGLPDGAFKPVTGDDKRIARKMKANNRQEREGQLTLYDQAGIPDIRALARRWRELEDRPDADVATIRQKARTYEELRGPHTDWWTLWTACNLWTAAFFQRYPQPEGTPPITTATVRAYLNRPQAADGRVVGYANGLAARERFFHWPLEFPEVFAPRPTGRGEEARATGFDVVLGNPPWERIKLQEKEFFATRDPEIANAPNAAARKRLIRRLPERNPALWQEYQEALHTSESVSRFLRESGFYPLTGRGDINTYSVFAGRMRALLRPGGRAGVIVPTGIATDDTNKRFFADLVEQGGLVSLYDFENREKLFPAVDSRYKFCLLTMRAPVEGQKTAPARLAFFCTRTAHLRDPRRVFSLTPADIARINPNTRTLPVFRTRQDAELTKAIYERVPVLLMDKERYIDFVLQTYGFEEEVEAPKRNPWGVRFLRMFDMSNDSHLFRTREQLEAAGYRLVGNRFVRGEEVWLPLYEAKMIWHYDHRFGTYEGVTSRRSTHLPNPGPEEHADPAFLPRLWYWVPAEEVEARLGDWKRGWLLGFRNVTNATNERTAIFSLLPRVGVGNNLPIVLLGDLPAHLFAGLAVNLQGLAFDWVVRQKLAGVNMNFFYVEQLPVLPPSSYTAEDIAFIVPRVLELVYTSWDMKPFADDVWREAVGAQGLAPNAGATGQSPLRAAIRAQWEANAAATGGHTWDLPDWAAAYPEITPPSPSGRGAGGEGEGIPFPPFKWDDPSAGSGRRAVLRAELDAYYARLYGLTRKQLRYILDPADLTPKELEDILDPWEEVADPLDPEGYAARVAASDFPGETFRVLKAKEIKQYGEYRTRRLVLEAWARLEAGEPSPVLSAGAAPPTEATATPAGALPSEARAAPAPQEAEPRQNAPATDPNAYALFRCRACGQFVLGFDRENHRRTLHAGEQVGFERIH